MLELSEVESFLMKCLWDKEHVKREQRVLDTIVYKEGRPFAGSSATMRDM